MMNKTKFVFALILLTALLLSLTSLAAAEGQNGTTLETYKTAVGHWTRTFHWTIDKSVTPETLNMFTGDSGTSQYTIDVTKDAGTDSFSVSGEVCVTNGGGEATENLLIGDNILYKTGAGQFQVLESFQVDTSINPVLDPGESQCYPYNHAFTPVAGATYKNEAAITITNHSGDLGVPVGPSPKADFSLPATPALINDSINVDDSNGGSWPFSDDGSVSYEETFTCDADEGTHNNTATIRETSQSDDASVTVNCYALTVTKDASTSFDRTYDWSIEKSADQSSLTLAPGQSFLVNYSVLVDVAGHTDSNFAVNGNITVNNPAPIDATLNGVSDVVSGPITGEVDCGVTFPYTLAAGATLTCSYTAALPDAQPRTNTATATLQNSPSGTTDFSGSAAVSFAEATMTEFDECIDVSDTLAGNLGTVCVGDAPQTFSYSSTVGPYEACGLYTVDNTAAFVTNDNGATGSSAWTVNVNVPCAGGCTLTIGYWKNHAGFGPQADMVTEHLPQYLGTQFLGLPLGKSIKVDTAALAVQYLGFNGSDNVFSGSNGINKLYAQLLGAKLSIAAGASDSAVAATISAADLFLTTHNSTDWNGLTKTQKNQVLAWVVALDNYNNGLTGPGHCSE